MARGERNAEKTGNLTSSLRKIYVATTSKCVPNFPTKNRDDVKLSKIAYMLPACSCSINVNEYDYFGKL